MQRFLQEIRQASRERVEADSCLGISAHEERLAGTLAHGGVPVQPEPRRGLLLLAYPTQINASVLQGWSLRRLTVVLDLVVCQIAAFDWLEMNLQNKNHIDGRRKPEKSYRRFNSSSECQAVHSQVSRMKRSEWEIWEITGNEELGTKESRRI